MFGRAMGRRAGSEPDLPAPVRASKLLARVSADACAGARDRGGARRVQAGGGADGCDGDVEGDVSGGEDFLNVLVRRRVRVFPSA